ncbi:MAG: peptidoglycan editing factor PgeF [Trueperaceae bacterium]
MRAPAQPARSQRYFTDDLAVLHGFTLRKGGVSTEPYGSLNLGLSSGDEPDKVERNRDLLLSELGFERAQVSAFHQVHGDRVYTGGPTWFHEKADAAVSADPNELLVVSVADCLPMLFHDPVTGAVGAAHCGWRGTVAGLASTVVQRMAAEFGSEPADLRVVMGPGVAGACYQVGAEVVERFALAGFPDHVAWPDAETGKYRLDIKAANRWSLERAGVTPGNVTDTGLCTHCHPERFYSYRRDAGVTGRHWAFISARPAPGLNGP